MESTKSIESIFNKKSETKTVDFYKHFLEKGIIEKVVAKLEEVYRNETYDDETGDVIGSEKMSEDEMISKFTSLARINFVELKESDVQLISGIPVIVCEEENIHSTSNYADAGGFIIEERGKIAGLCVVKHGSEKNLDSDLRHELVHLATSVLELGNLTPVFSIISPEDGYTELNQSEITRYGLAHDFIDESLAYGQNGFDVNKKFTAQEIQDHYFYMPGTEIVEGYNLNQNSEILAKIINETITDRTGKKQFRFNYYLIKHVKSLDDLDFTDKNTADSFTKITGIKVSEVAGTHA